MSSRGGFAVAWALASALALGSTACGNAEPLARSQAGVFGGLPAPDDTAVVAVVNFAGGQCSGSLITPNLVMTARHCVADTAGKEVQVVCGETVFQPPDSPGAIFVVPRPEITNDTQDYVAVAEISMPSDQGDDLCGTDVVLLRLKTPLTDIPPLTPRVDAPASAPEPYSSVGFGLDESLADKPSGTRKRLDGLQVLCAGGACRDAQIKSNEWIGSGGPCQGDSGGPALDANAEVIGVVSRGTMGCKQPVFSDVASRGAWLKSEAVRAAKAAKLPPPAWAPCGADNPCADLAPKPDGPAETCALSRAPRAGLFGWLLLAGLGWRLNRRARKNTSRRRDPSL